MSRLILVIYRIDTVASTIQTSVDTTKNVAAAAVDKGTSLVGTAKGSTFFHIL